MCYRTEPNSGPLAYLAAKPNYVSVVVKESTVFIAGHQAWQWEKASDPLQLGV